MIQQSYRNLFMQTKITFVLSFIFLQIVFVQNSVADEVKEKKIIGGLEEVRVLPHSLRFNAKVDTGAKNSSMHATNIEIFSQGDEEFVKFKTKDSNDQSSMMELPLLRKAKIKRHGGDSMTRAVVEMGICLGATYKVVQVTLIDRSRFKFPFLIGASFLKDDFLVDVGQSFSGKASCNSVTGEK